MSESKGADGTVDGSDFLLWQRGFGLILQLIRILIGLLLPAVQTG